MQRALVVAAWIIAANLTWSNFKDELIAPAFAQVAKTMAIDRTVHCNYRDECAVRVWVSDRPQ